jgi:hypothetical protein
MARRGRKTIEEQVLFVKPGSRENWPDEGFEAVIRPAPPVGASISLEAIWACGHEHGTQREALACAESMITYWNSISREKRERGQRASHMVV